VIVPSISGRFRRDVKRMERRGKDLSKLRVAIDLLCLGHPLPAKYKDHPLVGDLQGSRDCHLEPDWILIYTRTDHRSGLRLERTGTHADLFD